MNAGDIRKFPSMVHVVSTCKPQSSHGILSLMEEKEKLEALPPRNMHLTPGI